MNSPRLYLALDNCFAVKRWITPSQWMPLSKELGYSSIEASTDNEMDPLFSSESYRDSWVKEVEEQEKKLGMKVRSFFTGYQTYRTAGLAHPDPRVREKIKDGWYKPLIKHAQRLQADIGFSFHAVQEEDLQDPAKFKKAGELVCREYAELAAFAGDHGGVNLCCEQMYAPYQTPWTVEDTKQLLKGVFALGGHPFYTAVDVGHMIGQRKFTAPDEERVSGALKVLRESGRLRGLWFGPLQAYDKLKAQAARPASDDGAFVKEFLEYLRDYAYMFAPADDGDPYKWLKELGAYSPIMHMQQTDGAASPHAPFTRETAQKGLIKGQEFLEALAEAYARPEEPGMPPKTDKIVMAFEIFISNTQYPYDALENLKETIAYWKQFVPEDGMTLDECLKRL